MNQISNLYQKNEKFILGSNNEWLTNLRSKILEKIDDLGPPSKKNEIWKYSNLSHINDTRYEPSNEILKENETLNEENEIDYINGKYHITEKNKKNSNINFKDLGESLIDLKNFFYNENETQLNDFVIDINTIFLSDGLYISTKENKENYLIINYKNNLDYITNYLRNIIKINKNSKLTLVENFNYEKSENNDLNIYNNFILEKDSELEHIIIQNLNLTSRLLYSSHAICETNSKFNQLSCQLGSISAKNRHLSNLIGINSQANHNGIYFGKNKQYIDNKTKVTHKSENCQSNQIYKGILNEESCGVYLSNTLVESQAQKTNGYQLSRGLLLSDKSKLYNKPQLKIYADDVKCSHGSTIGALDNNQLYYLQSRGLSEKDSQKLLIKAFCKDVLKNINDKESLKKIELQIDKWLNKKNDKQYS